MFLLIYSILWTRDSSEGCRVGGDCLKWGHLHDKCFNIVIFILNLKYQILLTFTKEDYLVTL